MAWMEKLMMQVGLVDSVTKPLRHIEQNITQLGRKSSASWATMAGGTAAVVSGVMAIQATMAPAIEMDRALAEVASLSVHQETLKALGRTALEFSVEYGRSATDFVRASYDIQSAIAGLEGNELPAFARASGVLAMATKADAATITSYMGTMYGIFEKQAIAQGKASWIEDLAGKTAQSVEMFKTSGKGLSDAFISLGANATTAGIDINEQFAVLGMLQASTPGAGAGTQFASFLAGVGKAQKQLGLQFTDSAGNMLPVLDILEKLKARYGETLTVAASDELEKAFGSQVAGKMIKQLIDKTGALRTNINTLGNTHGMSKAEQMAATMTDQWERLGATWYAIRAAAFGQLTPTINDLIEHFIDGGKVLLRWTQLFPNLTRVVTIAVAAIAGLAAFAGLWAILAGVGGMLAALAWPILAVAAAVAALVLWWEPIKAFGSGLLEALSPAISQVFEPWADILPVIIEGLGAAFDQISAWLGATDEASGAFTNMVALGHSAGTVLGAIFKVIYAPVWALGKLIKWVLEQFNKLPGVNVGVGDMPAIEMPNVESLQIPLTIVPPHMPTLGAGASAPLAPLAPLEQYRQSAPANVPSGGLGQQLIQANAAATAKTQKPSRSINTGDVHMHVQNPLSPEQLEKELWMTTRG